MSPTTAKLLRFVCFAVSVALFIGAGAWMIVGEDKSNGIFAILLAVIVSRVLVIDAAGWLERKANEPE